MSEFKPDVGIEQKRFKIQKMGNTNSCPVGHLTYYRLITTDGITSYCMICFALGWYDPDKKPLELTGGTKIPIR